MKVSRDKIDEKLHMLHKNSQIPAKPTAEPVYSLPPGFEKGIFTENYSQESIQELSNHIGYYLGLLHSIKITIGIESSEDMLADVKTMDEAGRIGLYKVRGGYQREIQLTKKFRFQLKHILAILAHESMHNYLYNKGIKENDTAENEILTDVSAAYFGLGQLVLSGYEPITWTSDHWSRGNEYGHTTHTYTIGYVPYQMIDYAIYRSAILREEKEFIKILPFSSRLMLRFHLWRKNKKKEKLRKKIEEIITSLRNTQSSYGRITDVVQFTPIEKWSKDIPADAGKALVDLVNNITADEFRRSIDDVLRRIKKYQNDINPDDIKSFHKEALDLSHKVSEWNRIVQSYGKQR
jgi:hypothetical protein